MNCKNHADKLASYQCGNCKNSFCETCVMIRRFTDEFTAYVCKECGGKCDLILADDAKGKPAKPKLFTPKPGAVKEIKVRGEKIVRDRSAAPAREIKAVSSGYWASFLGAFVFPLRSTGIFKLILATGLFYGLSELSRISPLTGMGLSIPCLVYLVLYLFRIIEDTLKGEGRLPKLPDLNYWVEDAGIVIYLAFGIVAYLAPANVYFLLTKNFDAVYFILFFLGCLALPVAIIRIAIERRLAALNPVAVFSAVAKTFFPYAVTLIVMGAVKFLIFYAYDVFLYDYDWLGFLGLQFLIAYKLFVEMRILGLFGRFFQDKIIALPKGAAA